jgi:hypothetical protein
MRLQQQQPGHRLPVLVRRFIELRYPQHGRILRVTGRAPKQIGFRVRRLRRRRRNLAITVTISKPDSISDPASGPACGPPEEDRRLQAEEDRKRSRRLRKLRRLPVRQAEADRKLTGIRILLSLGTICELCLRQRVPIYERLRKSGPTPLAVQAVWHV